MVQQLAQRDIGGDIGRAFSQSLSEQLPKSYDRHTLSEGLRKIGEKPGLSEYDKIAEIAKLPGGMEHIGTLLPAIQRSQQNKALQERVGNENAMAQQQPNIAEPEVAEIPGLVSAEDLKKVNQSLKQTPDQREINKLASTYLSRGEEYDVKSAINRAEEELGKNIKAQSDVLNKFTTDLNQDMATALQGSGISDYTKSTGEITKRLSDYGKSLIVAKGLTPEAAKEEVLSKVLELSKAAVQTKANGVGFNKSQKEKESNIRAQQKIFSKYGFDDIYSDIVAGSVGITPMKAASILEPVHNKSFISEANKISTSPSAGFKVGLSYTPNDKQMNTLISKIKPQDNILSLEHELRDKKINLAEFRNKLNEPEFYDKLTQRQNPQLTKNAQNSILDDLAFKWL